MKERDFNVPSDIPKINCRTYKDNTGALELIRLLKMRPPTKHINVVYHHFCDYNCRGLISVVGNESENQWAGILTKSLGLLMFLRLRKKAFDF